MANQSKLAIIVTAQDQASKVLARVGLNAGRLTGGLKQMATGVGQVAGGLAVLATKAAAAAVTGIGLAVKVGMDFQDAFAGVKKTVEGTPEQLDALYKSLQQLSTRIPISFQDLAAIAQEGGALGVPTDKVAAFAEAVARLTAATVGLDETTASEAFGKLGTIFNLQDVDQGYERLGSALIELGNNAASTEPDIIDIAERFAAAGSAAGLSAAQVLGWSSAIGSLGQEPQAAGSALQQLFQRVLRDAGLGGKALKAVASTAGMTAGQFKKALGEDAGKAIESFLAGLNKLSPTAQQLVLKDAQLSNVRVDQGILQLASHLGLLDTSIDQATQAWSDNNALVDVSNKRFDTLKNKLIELKNKGFVALANFAEGIEPSLGRLADKVGAFLDLHMGDITQLGVRIGDAIDGIDWTEVEKGAEQVYDWLKQGFDILRQIPPQIDLAVAAFLGLNKLSGGLLGAGFGNILGGAANVLGGGIARGIAAQVPGLGRLVATPVYITGVAPGVALGGGLGGMAGGGSRIVQAVKVIGAVTIAGAALEQVLQTQQDQNASIAQQHQSNEDAIAAYLATNPSSGDIQKHIDQIEATKNNPLNFAELNIGSFLGLNGLTDLNAEEARLQAALAKGQTQVGEHSSLGANAVSAANAAAAAARGYGGEHAGQSAADAAAESAAQRQLVALQKADTQLNAIHLDFLAQRRSLATATDPATILKAAQGLAKDILGGVGSVGATKSAIDQLKAAELTVTDPTTRRALDKLIGQLETRLDSRKWISGILSTDEKLLGKTTVSTSDLGHVKSDIAQLRAHGDTHAASILSNLVSHAKTQTDIQREAKANAARAAATQKAATDETNRHVIQVGQDIKTTRSIVNVTVPLYVTATTYLSTRDIDNRTKVVARYGKPVAV